MHPGFHQAYARRIAWKVRLLLALFLLLLVLVHPLGVLLSLVSLLLPSRPFERRALQEIAYRYGLAYQTALEYREDPLWEAARRTKAQLPPFPWGILGLYLAALLAAFLLVLPPRTPSSFPLEPPIPQTTSREGQPGPGENLEGTGSNGSESEKPPSSSSAEPKDPNPSPEPSPSQSGEASPQIGSQASSSQPGPGPGVTSPQGTQETTPIPPLSPSLGEEAPLPLGQAETEEGPPSLPSPWPEGPPKEVKRSAEVYLQETEPPPEVRELIRRYFSP